MRETALEQPSRAETAVVYLVTLAALALLGWVLAYWTWAWLAPRPEPHAEAVAPPGGTIAAASTLFGSAQRSAAAPTGMAVKLLGVVAASRGRRGYAVVELEPKQVVVASDGQDIGPGVRLVEIHPDHVVLERNGTRETLAWPERTKASALPPQPAASIRGQMIPGR